MNFGACHVGFPLAGLIDSASQRLFLIVDQIGRFAEEPCAIRANERCESISRTMFQFGPFMAAGGWALALHTRRHAHIRDRSGSTRGWRQERAFPPAIR